MASQNGQANIVAQRKISKIKIPVPNLLVELCTGIFIYLFSIYSSAKKVGPILVTSFQFLKQNLHFSSLHLKRYHKLEGNICVDPLVIEVQ